MGGGFGRLPDIRDAEPIVRVADDEARSFEKVEVEGVFKRRNSSRSRNKSAIGSGPSRARRFFLFLPGENVVREAFRLRALTIDTVL
jgi:hypothetical protein